MQKGLKRKGREQSGEESERERERERERASNERADEVELIAIAN